MNVVLDASAVLAYLRDEPGAEVVAAAIDAWVTDASAMPMVGTVNWTEIAQRVSDRGVLADLATVVELVAFDVATAEAAAELWPRTRELGLSLADRACLALAEVRRVPVLTADREWSSVPLGVEIRQIRRGPRG